MTAQPVPVQPAPARYRSKSLAAWLALLGGALGLHRLYLHGPRDGLAWGHWLPTVAGWIGLQRLQQLGQDDQMAWLLLPCFGLMLSLGALMAIVYGLTPDERWDARYNPGQPGRSTTWAPVLAAVAALLLGGGVLMGTITYAVQMFFQWQLQPPAAVSAACSASISASIPTAARDVAATRPQDGGQSASCGSLSSA
jgi:hypothetical protein